MPHADVNVECAWEMEMKHEEAEGRGERLQRDVVGGEVETRWMGSAEWSVWKGEIGRMRRNGDGRR